MANVYNRSRHYPAAVNFLIKNYDFKALKVLNQVAQTAPYITFFIKNCVFSKNYKYFVYIMKTMCLKKVSKILL